MKPVRGLLLLVLALALVMPVLIGCHGFVYTSRGSAHVAQSWWYYPNWDVYHCSATGVWWYYDGAVWVSAHSRPYWFPSSTVSYVVIEHEGPKPWVYWSRHQRVYVTPSRHYYYDSRSYTPQRSEPPRSEPPRYEQPRSEPPRVQPNPTPQPVPRPAPKPVTPNSQRYTPQPRPAPAPAPAPSLDPKPAPAPAPRPAPSRNSDSDRSLTPGLRDRNSR